MLHKRDLEFHLEEEVSRKNGKNLRKSNLKVYFIVILT